MIARIFKYTQEKQSKTDREGVTRTLYSIALSLLMCADGLALEIDCTRSIESEGPYAALDFNLREVVDLGPANDAEGTENAPIGRSGCSAG